MPPAPRHFQLTSRRSGALALVALLAVGALSGCTGNPDPREWNAAAKQNFIEGCTTEVRAADGTTTSLLLADRSDCECIYDKIRDGGEFALDWDVMKEYENRQAEAKAGDLPTPPKQLTSAISACQEKGPAADGGEGGEG